jgi:hypothetical protein
MSDHAEPIESLFAEAVSLADPAARPGRSIASGYYSPRASWSQARV